jgi:hypothetical protein
MANRLHQVLTFTNVAAAGQAVLPHNINVNDVALLPDILFLDNGDFSVISCTTTALTVQNNGIGADSVDVWLFRLHTFDREFGPSSVVNLSPQPFVVTGGGGGGGGGSGNPQAFRYIATGAEGSDFFVTLPAARPTDIYRVSVVCSGVTSIVDFDAADLLVGDRTTTQFRLITSASLTAGDQFDILVFDQLP